MATTPEAAAAKWAQGMQAAGPKITAGIQAVTVAPGVAAARQADLYQANVVAAVPKWKANVAAVPLGDWQNATITKGVPRIASGAAAAQPAFAMFMGKLLPFIDNSVRSLPPRGNLEQNIARMTQHVRKMATFSNA